MSCVFVCFEELQRILINSSLLTEHGQLTVAGCVLFARAPLRFYAGAGASFAVMQEHNGTAPEILEENGEGVVRIQKKRPG